MNRRNILIVLVAIIAALASYFYYADADYYMKRGNYYFAGGAYDLDKAEKFFKRALDRDPETPQAHYQLARIYLAKKDFGMALGEIEKEIELYPENLRSFYVRGLIFAEKKDFSKAEIDFKKFIEWAPSEWAGYNDLAWVLASQNKNEEAKEYLILSFQEVENGDKNPWLLNSYGVSLLNLDEGEEAEAAFLLAAEEFKSYSAEDWQKAYPGGNPGQAEGGLESFRETLKENLKKVRSGE